MANPPHYTGPKHPNYKHGKTKSPEYLIWQAMLNRCYNPKVNGYGRYGGRGIKVCERWRQSFVAFISDMGERPTNKHTIERHDNDGDYCPENCSWQTRRVQCRNRRSNVVVTYQGITSCLQDLVERLGLPYLMVYKRLRKGMTIEQAVETPHRGWPRRSNPDNE